MNDPRFHRGERKSEPTEDARTVDAISAEFGRRGWMPSRGWLSHCVVAGRFAGYDHDGNEVEGWGLDYPTANVSQAMLVRILANTMDYDTLRAALDHKEQHDERQVPRMCA